MDGVVKNPVTGFSLGTSPVWKGVSVPKPGYVIFLFFIIPCFSINICSQSNTDLNIAMVQMLSSEDQALNIKRGEAYCREAKALDADIALFPEMINIGYNAVDFDQPGAMEKWNSLAIHKDGSFVRHFQELAKELDMAIVITYLEKTGDLPKNSSSLIDRHGNVIMTYSKVHTVDPFPMESAVQPGEDFYVATLDTRSGSLKVGIMTCYDREFPESARILMLKGAEVILTPNACGLDSLRIMQFRVRAWENSVVTAMANYAGTDTDDRYNGRSCMFSADGSEILTAGKKPGVYMGSVNIEDVREYRGWTYWGNAYRRPHRYKKLISPEVNEPFIRKNGFGKPFNRLER